MPPAQLVSIAVSLVLDENVTERLIRALMDLGYDATSVGRLGLKGLSDPLQLLFAAQTARAIVTHNVHDFTLLHEGWLAWSGAWGAADQAKHAGILLVYPGGGVAVIHIASAIDELLSQGSDLTNALWSWSRRGGWRALD